MLDLLSASTFEKGIELIVRLKYPDKYNDSRKALFVDKGG